MKKIFFSFLSILLIFSMSVTSFAELTLDELPPSQSAVETPAETEQPAVETPAETEQPAVETPADDSTLADINNKLDTLLESQVTETEPETEINPPLADDLTLVGINTYGLNPITPQNTTGLKSVIVSLIGDYDAVVVEYQYQKDNGEFAYLRQIQPDYVFFCSAGVFVVIIYCIFRLGGALIG